MRNKHLLILLSMCVFCGSLLPWESHGEVYVEPSQILYYDTVVVGPGETAIYPVTYSADSSNVQLRLILNVMGGANNDINVFLLDSENFDRYSVGSQFFVYQDASGLVKNSMNVSFVPPKPDTYRFILDNRNSIIAKKTVNLNISVLYSELLPGHQATKKSWENFYAALKKFFIFPDFDITVKRCGTENAYSDPNITICDELIAAYNQHGHAEALVWTLFHEMGHSLLRLWGYPTWDNEDTADEFATVMFVMSGDQEKTAKILQEVVDEWATRSSKSEAMGKLYQDDRHTLSIQRARNISNWIKQSDEIARRWQKWFVPNLQTSVLVELSGKPKTWTDMKLVQEELQKRGVIKGN